MRKRIFILCFLSGILLLVAPSISALKIFTLREENKSFMFEKIKSIIDENTEEKFVGGFGLLELLIGLLMLLYIELGIIFNRSFTLILLLADVLYEIGIRLGLIDYTETV